MRAKDPAGAGARDDAGGPAGAPASGDRRPPV